MTLEEEVALAYKRLAHVEDQRDELVALLAHARRPLRRRVLEVLHRVGGHGSRSACR